jgi:hypothetical protein
MSNLVSFKYRVVDKYRSLFEGGMGIEDDLIEYDSSHDADVESSTRFQLLKVDPSVLKDIQDKLRKKTILKTYKDFKMFFGQQ